MNTSVQMAMPQTATRDRTKGIRPPPYYIEYGFYAILFYGMFSYALGIAFPLIGGGGILGLAVLCAIHFGSRSRKLYNPIALALGCAISVLLLQSLVYQESLMNGDLRSYTTWALSLIIVQALSFRQGFFHRFAIFAFLLGCATLPWLETYGSTDELTRWGVSHDVGLANPNIFGMWFGFCSVYFIVLGLETRNNNIVRLASWSVGLLSLFLVAITVSRTPLVGVAIATVVAFQKVLKRSFLPILILLFLTWIIFATGLFDEVLGYYTERGTKESGRSILWAMGFDMFMESWWGGYGISHSYVPAPNGRAGTPHNALLYIGLSSGIISVVFFVGYLGRAGLRAFRSRVSKNPLAPFLLPLYLFALLEMMTLDTVFMSPWVMVIFSAAMGAGRASRVRQKAKGIGTG